MTDIFKKTFSKYGYLLITAAWLFTISFLFSNYWSYRSSAKKVQRSIENRIAESEKRFIEITNDSSLVLKLHKGSYKNEEQPEIFDESFGFFIYTQNDIGNPILSFWSSHISEPVANDVLRKDGSYFVHYKNGYFVLQKKTLHVRNERLITVGLYPVKWDFFLENKYLKSEFEGLPGIEKAYDISTELKGHVIKSSSGKALFSIKGVDKEDLYRYDITTIILRVLSIIFLFLYFNAVANDVVDKFGLLKGAAFLLGVIIIFRLFTAYLPFPFDFKKIQLFDASIYASSRWLPSLGDLLLNSILLFWLVIFIKSHFQERQQLTFKVSERQSWLFHGIILSLLVLSVFQLVDLVKSLVTDSQISFDVIDFFSLNIYTVTSFAILCMLVICIYHSTQVFLHFLNLLPQVPFLYKILLTAGLGLLFLSFSFFDASNSLNVIVLAWLLLFMYFLEKRNDDWQKSILKSPYFIFWMMFFSLSVTGIIVYQNNEIELEKRKKIAEKLSLQTDPSGENLIAIAITNINDQWLKENYHRFSNEHENKHLKDSLTVENFSGYLNKYDTKIYTYDSLFHPLYNDDSTTTYAVIKSILLTQAKKTDTENLFYYESSFERFSYLYEKQVNDEQNNTAGYLFVIAAPKRYKSEALYPELFKQVNDVSADLNTNYSYAIYSKGKLINNFNNFNFSSHLDPQQIPKLETEYRSFTGRSELWYKPAANKVIVIVKKKATLLEFVTLFAYIFFSFLFIVLLYHAGKFIINSNFRLKNILKAFSFSIRNQIHFTIIFISFFSFVIIGIATISFFIIRFEKSNTDRLSRSIQVMANEIQSEINSQLVFDDISIYDLGYSNILDKKLAEISDIHNVDVNFYDRQGNLRVSTIPYVYNKGILNRKMDPVAYFEMRLKNKVQFLQNESVGKFTYLSIYVPIRNDANETLGYLNIPYLNSQKELNEEISNFLVTLINLNAFIFLLAGAIALFVANKITSSFSIISAKMQQVNLGQVNEEITWKNNDEIGALVNEYNKMVKKLEASANALAKSEREGAWREMARQVAHEIKNPLTPMKLSIQHLQRAIQSGSSNVKDLSERMAATLIEQIDQLSKIAADFSQFANIGNMKPDVINVEDILRSLIGLYSSDEKLNLHFESKASNAVIYADKTQINRLFTNLIKNAIEASPVEEKVNLHIHIENDSDEVLVSIRDEGSGIPEEMQRKIFQPNFTTKSSGTGLGLAICKAIVEKANGAIWFETTEGKGTTFLVAFPLYH